ncbi:MAG: hypothetical protein ACRDTM_05705 [Micromonosporaceae bacterium]
MGSAESESVEQEPSDEAGVDEAGVDEAGVEVAGVDEAGSDEARVAEVGLRDTEEIELAQPAFAAAPGVGTSIGALNVSTMSPLGWAGVAAGVLGTLLIAVSYLAGWLTASLEHFGVAETESLGMAEVTSDGLSWMYRVATLGLIGCAMALLFTPPQNRQVVRLAGFAAAGLALLTALIATLIIGAMLAQGAAYFGDADTVGYGWGVYAAYLGIAGVTSFVGFFEKMARRPY